jgi:hypothetical protein
MIDGVVAIAAQGRKPGLERVGDERLHDRRGRLDADGGGKLARRQHIGHLPSLLDRHHVRRRLILRHVLIAGEHPGDLAQIDAVFLLQDAARPHAGGDRVAAVDADLPAFEVFRRADAGVAVHQDGAMMKGAHQKHRYRRHSLAVRPGTDVGRDRHLADVELEAAHHAPECGDERIDLYELEGKGRRLDAAVLERLVVALGAGDGFHQMSDVGL